MAQFVVPGIELAGATGRIRVTSFNGTPAILRMIQTGRTVDMVVGENEAQLGYAGMDQMMRVLSGTPPIESGDEHIPLRVLDKQNVIETGVPPIQSRGYGNAWKTGYLKMWGLS
jgi:ribose transport system substrate-binding protein